MGFTAACRGSREGTTNVLGSTSIQPFAEMLSQEFNAQTTGRNVEVQGGGSKAGLEGVNNGIADIGMCSRDLKEDDPSEASCDPVIIAYDGLAIVVHPSNPVLKHGLTRWQIALIFSGDITNWKAVGGEDRTIHVITREEGSGTREAFAKLVMNEGIKDIKQHPEHASDYGHAPAQLRLIQFKGRIYTKAVTQESNGAVKELVRNDRATIGYMSLGLVTHDSGLAALDVDGITPTLEAVRDGSYPLKRPFIFAFRNGANVPKIAREFTEYVLSDAGQQLLEREGLVSLSPTQQQPLPWATTTPAEAGEPTEN